MKRDMSYATGYWKGRGDASADRDYENDGMDAETAQGYDEGYVDHAAWM